MSASTDVESQTPVARSRSRCLDTFLITSVIALFVVFIIALGGALAFARHIEDEINKRTSGKQEESTHSASFSSESHFPPSSYKMQNFAYLEPTKAEPKKGVMAWKNVKYGEGESVGSLYSFNKAHEALTVKEHGSFFMYVQLNFTCQFNCLSDQFDISFYSNSREVFTCSVSLPAKPQNNNRSVSKTCWQVVTFPEKGNRLNARADFKGDMKDWKLEFIGSGFGIFMIDGLQAVHHS